MKKVLLTRWGGAVQIDHSEVSSANSATLDFYYVRTLVELGYEVDIVPASKTLEKLISERSKDWYSHLHVLDGFPIESSDEYDFIVCLQNTENLRFGGFKGIPGQLWVYRLLRNLNTPFIYLQYDANVPLHLPPEVRGEDLSILGSTLHDISDKNINILSVGRNMKYYKSFGYSHSFHMCRFLSWEHDFHSIAIPMVREESLPVNPTPNKSISFVGKARRFGAKQDTLIGLANMLESEGLSDYYVDIYGDWKSVFKEDHVFPHQFKMNKKIKGLDKVLNVYNNSEFGILACNQFNLDLQQYTIRLFEMIAGGTIPITDEEYFKQWESVFTRETRDKLFKDYTFQTLGDVPEIIRKYNDKISNNPNYRKEFIEELRYSITSVITDEYVKSSLAKSLEEASTPQTTLTPSEKATMCIESLYQSQKSSKLKRIRENADMWGHKYKNLPLTVVESNHEMLKDPRKLWIFSNSELPDEEVIRLFKR